jgi:hypothetical protein
MTVLNSLWKGTILPLAGQINTEFSIHSNNILHIGTQFTAGYSPDGVSNVCPRMVKRQGKNKELHAVYRGP